DRAPERLRLRRRARDEDSLEHLGVPEETGLARHHVMLEPHALDLERAREPLAETRAIDDAFTLRRVPPEEDEVDGGASVEVRDETLAGPHPLVLAPTSLKSIVLNSACDHGNNRSGASVTSPWDARGRSRRPSRSCRRSALPPVAARRAKVRRSTGWSIST